MKVLVTGFEPFGGYRINSSREVARGLPRTAGGLRIVAAELPVVYGVASGMLRRLIALERPRAVISLGLAGGRSALSFETCARNLDDARIPDNDGRQPSAMTAIPGAPRSLPPTLPLPSVLARLRAAGFPVETSPSAGTFLCNHVFYHLLEHTWRAEPSLLAGFVHLPFIEADRDEHPGAPLLPLDVLVRGIREALLVLDA